MADKKEELEKPVASRYLASIYKPLENAGDIVPVFSEKEKELISNHMTYMSTGSTSMIPVICPGEAGCHYRNKCPLVKIDRARKEAAEREPTLLDDNLPEPFVSVVPVGKECSIEMSLLNEWTSMYLSEYEVTDESFTEIQMCRELAEIELMLWRINFKLATMENAFLVGEEVVGATRQGDLYYKEAPLAIFVVKERLQKRKSNLIKLMVGDRQEKYKKQSALKLRNAEDNSVKTAELRTALNKMISETSKVTLQLEKKESNVIDTAIDHIIDESNASEENRLAEPEDEVLD